MFWLTYQQKYTETFIDALHALMIRKDKHCNTYLTFTVLNTRGDRFVMFSVGLFSVFSDALKNNNNCVLNQNTTNEQWFIHVHHSLFLFFCFFTYFTRSVSWLCYKLNAQLYNLQISRSQLCSQYFAKTTVPMLIHVFQITIDTKPKPFKSSSILNTCNMHFYPFYITNIWKHNNTVLIG